MAGCSLRSSFPNQQLVDVGGSTAYDSAVLGWNSTRGTTGHVEEVAFPSPILVAAVQLTEPVPATLGHAVLAIRRADDQACFVVQGRAGR